MNVGLALVAPYQAPERSYRGEEGEGRRTRSMSRRRLVMMLNVEIVAACSSVSEF